MNKRKIKYCIVSSCGGHLTEIRSIRSLYSNSKYFYVLNEKIILPQDMKNKTYFVRHSERDLLFFVNLWEAWKILRQERPNIILSTGAGVIVPFTLVAKVLKIPVIYIEASTQISRPTLSGRLMYYLADKFFYQWEELGKFFPKGIYGGVILWSS
jgi:beta-1,4-N-acetylglucosaminyltransferase